MNISEKIKGIREVKRFTQRELAEKLSMTIGNYQKIEAGSVSITFDRLQQIADIFKMSVVEIINYGSDSVAGTNDTERVKELESRVKELESDKEILKNSLKDKEEIIGLIRGNYTSEKNNEVEWLINVIFDGYLSKKRGELFQTTYDELLKDESNFTQIKKEDKVIRQINEDLVEKMWQDIENDLETNAVHWFKKDFASLEEIKYLKDRGYLIDEKMFSKWFDYNSSKEVKIEIDLDENRIINDMRVIPIKN